jgi:hypothetical protein
VFQRKIAMFLKIDGMWRFIGFTYEEERIRKFEQENEHRTFVIEMPNEDM